MKFPKLSLLGLLLPSIVNAQCYDKNRAFHLSFEGACNYENLLKAFTTFWDDPIESYGCETSAEEELESLLGNTTITDICRSAYESYEPFPFANIANKGNDFVQTYFNGGTDWNEEYETMYPTDADGNPTNRLRTSGDQIGDAFRVKNIYDSEAQYGMIEWPDSLTNFNPETCNYNSAYCCWPKDRQANDNNGNCNSPYDTNCIDKDPSDNTNLCYVDMKSSGYELFPFDDENNNNNPTDRGEGQVHCHGFAWADYPEPSSAYKGNNLFYVSMYDHMSERGYVKNIPGAPMCACSEQMPIVERADCTQMDVDEAFKITYNGAEGFSAELTEIYVDFNACQGYDRFGHKDNNDLWSYMNRLYREGKISGDKLSFISKMLVGEHPDNCDIATDRFMKGKGYVTGYDHSSIWEPVASKGKFGTEYVGDFAFNKLIAESPNKIIRRVCADCYEAHQDIYIKRTKTSEDYNALDILHNLANEASKKAGHEWGVDFEIYSSYMDAREGKDQWNCTLTGYRYDKYFPGECGPQGYDQRSFRKQGARFFNPQHYHEGRDDVKFYVERDIARSGEQTELLRVDSIDIGGVAMAGATYETPMGEGTSRLYMMASGSDIWHHADEFQFMYSETEGDVELIANIIDMKHKSKWTKGGLMVRDTLEPGSKHCFMFRSGASGVTLQYRTETNGPTHAFHMYETKSVTSPYAKPWVKLVKSGTICTGFISATGEEDDWERIGNPVHINIGDPTEYIGLALTAQNDGQLAEMTVDDYEETYYQCSEVNSRRGARRRTSVI
mmetsp:Transcript_7047/g.9943  ORF Transcript_7047/g.9943 Transcript_7047/m.9943 type:complete len:784 (+) Transcript_7047:183-2534(+)